MQTHKYINHGGTGLASCIKVVEELGWGLVVLVVAGDQLDREVAAQEDREAVEVVDRLRLVGVVEDPLFLFGLLWWIDRSISDIDLNLWFGLGRLRDGIEGFYVEKWKVVEQK